MSQKWFERKSHDVVAAMSTCYSVGRTVNWVWNKTSGHRVCGQPTNS